MNCVTIEELMAYTGFGPNTARRMVRDRVLPGLIRGKHYICTRGEYEHWQRTGEVAQHQAKSTEPATKKRKPVSIIRLNGEAA